MSNLNNRDPSSLVTSIKALIQRHRAVPELHIGWERLRGWTGDHLSSLLGLVEQEGSEPRAARAGLLARLFWEGKTTAMRFRDDPEALLQFMNGGMRDAIDVCDALDALAKRQASPLREELAEDVAQLRAGVSKAAGDQRPQLWPWGRRLARNEQERDEYDALSAIYDKLSHATPFLILAPSGQRESGVHIFFLTARALEHAAELVAILENAPRGG